MDDETKKPVVLSAKELAWKFKRSKSTISRWLNGQKDQLGDPILDGELIREPGKDDRYRTTPERLGVLHDWLELSAPQKAPGGPRKRRVKTDRLPSGKRKPLPAYMKQDGARSQEDVTPDDLLTKPEKPDEFLNIEGLGPCKVVMRNRGWLHVFDRKSVVYRVRIADEKLATALMGLGVSEFWPFSDEDALRLVYGHEFPKPEESGT